MHEQINSHPTHKEEGDNYLIETKEKWKYTAPSNVHSGGGGSFREKTRRVMRKSDVALTKSISKGGNNRAVSWTIGFKPNANSKVGRFRARRQARKGSIAFADQGRILVPQSPGLGIDPARNVIRAYVRQV